MLPNAGWVEPACALFDVVLLPEDGLVELDVVLGGVPPLDGLESATVVGGLEVTPEDGGCGVAFAAAVVRV